MIKVLQQRSRWEQGRLEQQGLRLARSVPSINTVASSPGEHTTRGKGECKGCGVTVHTADQENVESNMTTCY